MNKEKSFRYLIRCLLLMFGAFVTGTAIGICNRSGLGADSITVFYDGFAKAAGISVGDASQWTSIIMIFLAALVDWHQLGVGTILTPYMTKCGIELAMGVLAMQTGFSGILYFILGITLIAIGIAIMVTMNLGKSSYDALLLGIVHRIKKSYSVVRWTFDSLLLITGFLLGGSVSVGTFIAIWYLGKAIPYFRNKIEESRVYKSCLIIS